MTVEKFCLKCLHEIFYDPTEAHYCCECTASAPVPDEDRMPSLEYAPGYWVDTEKMIAELRALQELREVCGMYCERLPVEVREALHAVPEIGKTHRCNLMLDIGPQI